MCPYQSLSIYSFVEALRDMVFFMQTVYTLETRISHHLPLIFLYCVVLGRQKGVGGTRFKAAKAVAIVSM